LSPQVILSLKIKIGLPPRQRLGSNRPCTHKGLSHRDFSEIAIRDFALYGSFDFKRPHILGCPHVLYPECPKSAVQITLEVDSVGRYVHWKDDDEGWHLGTTWAAARKS
jgi:hypothetical protein